LFSSELFPPRKLFDVNRGIAIYFRDGNKYSSPQTSEVIMIACFDIGGTAVKSGFATSGRHVQPFRREVTPKSDLRDFIACITTVLDEAPEKPEAISISLAGSVEPNTGNWKVANIPCLDGLAVEEEIGRAVHLPVTVSNDADCCALAESAFGAGRGHRIVFSIILGTGVGGGLIVNNRLINDPQASAGEWGHGLSQTVNEGPAEYRLLPQFPCGCGLVGCLDAMCGARGVERLHRHFTGKDLSAETILQNWGLGEHGASQTIESVLGMLAGPLALVVNVTGATIVPVGGGMSNCVPLVDALDRQVRRKTLRDFDRPLVVPAECRVEPGLIGAALVGFARQPSALDI
jgi:N-acetylglucosamine kinase